MKRAFAVCMVSLLAPSTGFCDEAEYDKRWNAISEMSSVASKAKAHFVLAKWCGVNISTAREKCELKKILAYAPDYESAGKSLGYVRYGDRWVIAESAGLWKKRMVKDSVAVLSFNVLRDLKNEPLWQWSKREKLVAEVIKMSGADIGGLQEVDVEIFASLRKLLKDYSIVVMSEKRDLESYPVYGGAVIYKTKRFEKIDTGYLIFHPSGKLEKWPGGGVVTRGGAWVKLKDKVTGRVYCVYSSHLEHSSIEANVGAGRILRKHAEELEQNINVIMTGDFNSKNGSETYKTLIGLGLSDSYGAMHKDKRAEIDWILYRGNLLPLNYQIIDYKKGLINASDHKAVLVEFGLKSLSSASADEYPE